MQKKANPKNKSSFLCHLFLCWVNSLVKIGSKRQVTEDDLFELSEEDKAENIVQDFEEVWENELIKAQVHGRPPRLWRAMASFFTWKDYVRLIFCRSWETFSIYSKPILLWFFLKLLIRRKSTENGHLLGLATAGIAVSTFIQAFAKQHNNLVSKMMGMRLTIGCTGLVHKKVNLVISHCSVQRRLSSAVNLYLSNK